MRPGHVVHVAEHDGGFVAAGHFLTHQQQLGIAPGAGFGLLGGRGLGVQAVEAHPGFAIGQLHMGVQRGNIVVELVFYLAAFERQAREKQQTVGVVEGLVAGVGVGFFERTQLLVPPLVGFDGHYHVGVGGAYGIEGQPALAVVLQHVHHREAEFGIGIVGAGAVGHSLAHQRRVRHNAQELVHGRAGQQDFKNPLGLSCAEAASQQHFRAERHQQPEHDLQAWEIADPNPPSGAANQGQQRGNQGNATNQPNQPLAGREPGRK